MLGSTGAGTPPEASNERFETPGKEDTLLVDVKLEDACGWTTKGWSETDSTVS